MYLEEYIYISSILMQMVYIFIIKIKTESGKLYPKPVNSTNSLQNMRDLLIQ